MRARFKGVMCTEMIGTPYSRAELESLEDGFPDRGILCSKCNTKIPVFEEMTVELESRVKKLIRENKKLMAMAELESALGCSKRWSKIWVIHSGKPTPEFPGPPCPYCGKPLKTSRAKFCMHCLTNWRETNDS